MTQNRYYKALAPLLDNASEDSSRLTETSPDLLRTLGKLARDPDSATEFLSFAASGVLEHQDPSGTAFRALSNHAPQTAEFCRRAFEVASGEPSPAGLRSLVTLLRCNTGYAAWMREDEQRRRFLEWSLAVADPTLKGSLLALAAPHASRDFEWHQELLSVLPRADTDWMGGLLTALLASGRIEPFRGIVSHVASSETDDERMEMLMGAISGTQEVARCVSRDPEAGQELRGIVARWVQHQAPGLLGPHVGERDRALGGAMLGMTVLAEQFGWQEALESTRALLAQAPGPRARTAVLGVWVRCPSGIPGEIAELAEAALEGLDGRIVANGWAARVLATAAVDDERWLARLDEFAQRAADAPFRRQLQGLAIDARRRAATNREKAGNR